MSSSRIPIPKASLRAPAGRAACRRREPAGR
jgi:hypothetical protein